jgi:hypothetical protein
MRTLILVLLVGALAACGSAIESADEDQISIRYHNFVDSPDFLRPMADEHCASYDRIAVYRTTTLGEGTIGFLTGLPLHAEFECRVPLTF